MGPRCSFHVSDQFEVNWRPKNTSSLEFKLLRDFNGSKHKKELKVHSVKWAEIQGKLETSAFRRENRLVLIYIPVPISTRDHARTTRYYLQTSSLPNTIKLFEQEETFFWIWNIWQTAGINIREMWFTELSCSTLPTYFHYVL